MNSTQIFWKTRTAFLFVILILISSASLALEGVDYINDDYNTIDDWKNIDWNQIPPERIPDVPPEFLEYTALDNEQRQSMNAEQIAANFDLIDDLTNDVNSAEAKDAISSEYDVIVTDLGNGAQIREGVLSATSGEEGHATLTGDEYQNGFLSVTEQGDILFRINPGNEEDSQINTLVIPESDKVTIDTQETTISFRENNIKGLFHVNEGRVYLRGPEEIEGGDEDELGFIVNSAAFATEVVINEVRITPLSVEELNIYFEEEEEFIGDFIFMKDGEMITKTSPGIEVEFAFYPGNHFFDMNENADLFINVKGSEFSIEQREGIIPLLSMRDEGEIRITNGRHDYLKEGDEFYYDDTLTSEKEGVAFTLMIKDEEGNNVFGSEEEKEIIIFDSLGSVIVVEEGLPEEQFECRECTVSFRESRFFYDYFSIQLLATSNVETLVMVEDPVVISRIMEMMEELPPEVRESIVTLYVLPEESSENVLAFNTICTRIGSLACADEESRRITVRQDVDYETFYHEAAHTRTYELEEKSPASLEFESYVIDLLEQYDLSASELEGGDDFRSYLTEEEDRRLDILSEAEGEERRNLFRTRWEENTGQPYGGFTRERQEGHVNSGTWQEHSVRSEEREPRYGFFDAYGSNNFYEDVATAIEPFAHGDFDLVRDLVDANSEFYQSRMGREIEGEIMTQDVAEEWARRYQGRVDLLFEGELITSENYYQVFQEEESLTIY